MEAVFNIYGRFTNFYYRLIRVENSQIWDNVAGALSASTAFADSCIDVTLDALVGGFIINLPVGLPDGSYDFLYYNSATKVYTDVPLHGLRIEVANNKMAKVPVELQ